MLETYNELLVTPSKYFQLFCDFILELGVDAIEEQNGSIIVRSEEDLSEIKFGVEEFAKKLSNAVSEKVDVSQILTQKENIDWIEKYKNSIQPVEIGKFYIHPTWEDDKEKFINILIDPALSFGTGHHESTSSCLEIIGDIVKEKDTVLDVGCGSGILSIAAAKLGALVDLCDTDPLSVKSAKKNFELNHVAHNNIWEGSANFAQEKYDTVIANIVADVLVMISGDLKKAVKQNGNLILSGILDKYLDKILSKYNDFQIMKNIKKGEWITLHLKKGK